jgi:signal transduction histidine kinase
MFGSVVFARLFFTTLFIIMMLVISSVGFAAKMYEERITQESTKRHDAVAHRMAREMALFFDQARFQLSLIGNNINAMSPSDGQLQFAFNNFLVTAPHFVELSYLDGNGIEVVSTSSIEKGRDATHTNAYLFTRNKSSWTSKIDVADTRLPKMTIAAPIVSLNKYAGTIVGTLSLMKLWLWIDEINIQSGTRLSVIKAESGVVIADEEKTLIGKRHPYWTKDTVNSFLTVPTGRVYLSFHPLPDLDLTIVTISPVTSFARALYAVRSQLGWGVCGLLVVTSIVAAFFARSATTPVKELTRIMSQYGETGKWDPSNLYGEYLFIADNFHRTAQKITLKEKTIVQQQSLVSVGRVASGLAHELRHGLHLILNLFHLIKANRFEKETMRKTVNDMTVSIDGMMDFAKGSQINWDTVDSSHCIVRAIDSVKYSNLAKGVSIKQELEYPSVYFHGDVARIASAISNLLRNAVEAGATKVQVRAEQHDHIVRFVVRDNGSGIPKEAMENMFEPFFTTKNKGFGVGMSIVSAVVNAHNGTVSINKNDETGVEFWLNIPLNLEIPLQPVRTGIESVSDIIAISATLK